MGAGVRGSEQPAAAVTGRASARPRKEAPHLCACKGPNSPSLARSAFMSWGREHKAWPQGH